MRCLAPLSFDIPSWHLSIFYSFLLFSPFLSLVLHSLLSSPHSFTCGAASESKSGCQRVLAKDNFTQLQGVPMCKVNDCWLMTSAPSLLPSCSCRHLLDCWTSFMCLSSYSPSPYLPSYLPSYPIIPPCRTFPFPFFTLSALPICLNCNLSFLCFFPFLLRDTFSSFSLLTHTHTHSHTHPPTPTQACYPIFSKDPNFRGLRIDRNYPQNWKNQPSSTMKTLFNGEVKEEEEEEEEDRGRGAAEEFPEGTYRMHPV